MKLTAATGRMQLRIPTMYCSGHEFIGERIWVSWTTVQKQGQFQLHVLRSLLCRKHFVAWWTLNQDEALAPPRGVQLPNVVLSQGSRIAVASTWPPCRFLLWDVCVGLWLRNQEWERPCLFVAWQCDFVSHASSISSLQSCLRFVGPVFWLRECPPSFQWCY